MGLLLLPQISQKNVEHWWNDIWQGRPEILVNLLPSATMFTPHSTWNTPGVNTCLRGDKLAVNRPRFGTLTDYVSHNSDVCLSLFTCNRNL